MSTKIGSRLTKVIRPEVRWPNEPRFNAWLIVAGASVMVVLAVIVTVYFYFQTHLPFQVILNTV